MLNVYFCYIKIFLSIYCVYYDFVIKKNYRAAHKLKKVKKHCSRPVLRYFFEPAAHFEKFFKLTNTWTWCKELNFECFPLPEVSFGCLKKPKNFNLNSKNKVMTFFHLQLPICAYCAQSSLGKN